MISRGLIMVIDGDATARESLTAYLTKIGYEPRAAEDDRQAMTLLRGEDWPVAVVRDASDLFIAGNPFIERMRSGPKRPPALLSMVKPFQMVDFGDKLLRAVRQSALTAN